MRSVRGLGICVGIAFCLSFASGPLRGDDPLPGLEEVIRAKSDLWGEAAMRQPDGASYELFRDLLPAPRYVHADFRFYPVVLSPPDTGVKARLISNGSGVNLKGGSRSWKDPGTPVTFRVGPEEYRFGELADRVSLPELADGYLPIVRIEYRHPFPVNSEGAVPLNQQASDRVAEVYRLEAFASLNPDHADFGIVWVRFSLAAGSKGLVSLDVDASGLDFVRQQIRTAGNEAASILLVCDDRWKWARGRAQAALSAPPAGQSPDSAVIAIATRPLPLDFQLSCSEDVWQEERRRAVNGWKEILARGMQVSIPEDLVQNCWRNLILQNFSLLNRNRMFYSAGNQYEALYEAEGSEAALAMLMWGYEAETRNMLGPLLDFQRAGLKSNISGLKLNSLVRWYWQTQDAETLRQLRDKWQPAVDHLLSSRQPENGLLPKERYCGDISTPVHSLSVHAKAWRGLHDLAVVLRDVGDDELAAKCRIAASELHAAILQAVGQSLRKETTPPFIPNALLDQEPIHDPITEVRIGSYWNIIMPHVMSGRLFPAGSEEETWLPHYMEQHGGICMGLVRSGGTAHGFWTGPDRINPLYSNRYVVDALRRDDVDRALVSFYGMLAQGFTRNTFVGGEGCTLRPVDSGGRFFYCPPNSAANGFFLTMLRHMLIQDFDLDGNGRPESLRLMFGTSPRWLEHGKSVDVHNAPTAFGTVSCHLHSEIDQGRLTATVNLPQRNRPDRILLRLRLPAGFRWESATVIHRHSETGLPSETDRQPNAMDASVIDLTEFQGTLQIRFSVVKKSP